MFVYTKMMFKTNIYKRQKLIKKKAIKYFIFADQRKLIFIFRNNIKNNDNKFNNRRSELF